MREDIVGVLKVRISQTSVSVAAFTVERVAISFGSDVLCPMSVERSEKLQCSSSRQSWTRGSSYPEEHRDTLTICRPSCFQNCQYKFANCHFEQGGPTRSEEIDETSFSIKVHRCVEEVGSGDGNATTK